MVCAELGTLSAHALRMCVCRSGCLRVHRWVYAVFTRRVRLHLSLSLCTKNSDS